MARPRKVEERIVASFFHMLSKVWGDLGGELVEVGDDDM